MEDEKYNAAALRLLTTLHERAREKGITEQQIADKTGFIQSNVNRMFAGKYSPLLENFILLADAVGYHIEIKEN